MAINGVSAATWAQEFGIVRQNLTITPDMHTLALHIGGRVQGVPLRKLLPAGGISYSHQWPGVYFESAFSGERVILKFNDSANEYRV